MSEYSKPIRLEIDTTMMEDTEIRIIESHIEAIRRVGSGAQPQGQPDPVPEWRQFVDASPAWIKQAHRDDPRALAWTLENLAQVALEEEVPRTLARIVAICEAKVGDGWHAEPHRYDEATPLSAWGLLFAFRSGGGEKRPTRSDWEALAEHAAAWLRDITEATS